MQSYIVTCIEKLPSGNWRVKAKTGRPFVLIERNSRWKTPTVVWLRDPHPGRTVEVKLPDWLAMRKRQLVGDALYEANIARKRDLRQRRKTGADPQLWDRRFKTSRGALSTAELTSAKFGQTDAQRATMTRAAVEARGGRVMLLRVPEGFDPTGHGIPMAFERGRWRGKVTDG